MRVPTLASSPPSALVSRLSERQAERIIANWGGWGGRPLRGAVALRQRFHNSTEEMRAHGKCGVSASAVAELLAALAPIGRVEAWAWHQQTGVDAAMAGTATRATTTATATAGGSVGGVTTVPAGSAVYVCGQREGLEPLTLAGFKVWTQADVLSQAAAKKWKGHNAFLGLLDAAISTRARVYIAARGNFDRAVTAKRALRGLVTVDSQVRMRVQKQA